MHVILLGRMGKQEKKS